MEEDLNFFIDIEPISDFEAERRKVPLYNVRYDYTQAEKDKKMAEVKRPRGPYQCWNCGDQGHNLNACKLPKNSAMVAKNRRAFLEANKRKGTEKLPKRYHEQNEQKYAKFRPGILSRKLRDALGLSKSQLPRHVYNMRLLGYPPGWLLEAQVLPSSIQMYNGTGERVPGPEEEEGEVDNLNVKYNLDMLIDYPGFNTNPEPGTIEESHMYNSGFMNDEQRKENFIQQLQEQMRIRGSFIQSKGRFSDGEDMDAEDIPESLVFHADDKCKFVPPLPTEELPPLPPMEEKQTESETNKTTTEEEIEEPKTPDQPEDQPSDSSPFSNLGKVKSVYLGTPVLKGASPYMKVPSYEKFSQGMGQILNFENLPGTTGTYDKMCKVLQKVRDSLSGKK